MVKKIAFLLAAVLLIGSSILRTEAVYTYKPGWYFEYKVNLQQNTLILKGANSKEQFGSSLAKGDLDADGKDDIAIGSPYFSSSNDKISQGKASVFLNNRADPDITILGESKNHYLGTSVAFGDFNGDSIDDLAIGSINADKVWIFLGKAGMIFPQNIDLSKDSADITFKTAELNENFGFSLDMADINSDGIKDLIIGAPSANQIGKIRSGKIYVVFGYKYPSPQFVYDFNKIPPSIIIWGENALDQFGASITHGDVNGDKKMDIIAGAYLSNKKYQPQMGKVYVFFGKHPEDLSPYVKKPVEIKVPDVTIEGPGARNWFGYSVGSGDMNNDGLTDVAAGSFTYQSESKNGKAHIYYGNKMDYRATISINSPESFTIINNDKYEDIMGSSVGIVDINNDGKNDFIAGAPGIGERPSASPGHVYVFDNQNLANKTPILFIEGDRPNDWFGSVVLTADFNNDKYNDLIISAPNAYNSGKKEGAVYIIFGKDGWPGKYRYKNPSSEEPMSRAQFIHNIIQEFDMDAKNNEFLRQCKANPEFCLNKFIKNTSFKGIKFSPDITLYPDVKPDNIFYKEITEGVMLKIMEGFMEEKSGPFKPDNHIERIHALKVLLEASGMIKWKNKNALSAELGGEKEIKNQQTPFEDIHPEDFDSWWYPRYINYAYLSGIINDKGVFRPHDAIKQGELEEWIKAIKRITE